MHRAKQVCPSCVGEPCAAGYLPEEGAWPKGPKDSWCGVFVHGEPLTSPKAEANGAEGAAQRANRAGPRGAFCDQHDDVRRLPVHVHGPHMDVPGAAATACAAQAYVFVPGERDRGGICASAVHRD